MSSMTIYARGDRAVMLTDTAGTDSAFRIAGWVSKVFTVPHMKIALTVQGAAEAGLAFSAELPARFDSFDAMIEGGGSYLEELHQAHIMRWSDLAAAPEFVLGIVGWSVARKRFEAYHLQSNDNLGREPFTFVRQDVILAPMLHEQDLASLGATGPAMQADPLAVLLRLMKVQRRLAGPVPVPEPGGIMEGYCIGGEVVATEMTPAGISQRVVHRWPDRLGETIRLEPMPADVLAAVAAAPASGKLTRQQRRAVEAQARRSKSHAA